MTRRYRPGDIVWWNIPAGIGHWHTDGIGKVRTVHDGVFTLHDGQIVTTDEIAELIAAGDRPRARTAVA